ncbi:hypothetical protein EZS27_016415 [termite gut metagenome]|uniref:peptidoglycan glycosyltransferase n=1 Tax=termite gut metagenome TaxID=433724 RepID=A0A5J4RNZ6_9ZZZZ
MDLIRNIFKGDKVIWIIFLFFCVISIIEVFSAASTLTYASGNHWAPITQHCIFLIIGTILMVFVHNIHYKWFQVFPTLLYPVSLILLGLTLLSQKVETLYQRNSSSGLHHLHDRPYSIP